MKQEYDHPRSPGQDIFGNPICPGDYVVYANAKGRSAGMNFGKVISVEVQKQKNSLSPDMKLKLVGIDTYFGKLRVNGYRGWSDKPETAKPSAIGFGSRVCVVPDNAVPKWAKDMMDEAEKEVKDKELKKVLKSIKKDLDPLRYSED